MCKTNETFRSNIEEGWRAWGGPQQGTGVSQSVEGGQTVDVSSVFRCTALNTFEFEEVFSLKPIKKWTRYLPTSTVKALCPDSGIIVDELVWCFTWDPASPYRTLEVRIAEHVKQRTIFVSPGDICFKEQAKMAYEHFGSKKKKPPSTPSR